MKSEDLARCADEVRECADKQASNQTRARLLQVADRIEAALRGDDPTKPEPLVVTPEPVKSAAAAHKGGKS